MASFLWQAVWVQFLAMMLSLFFNSAWFAPALDREQALLTSAGGVGGVPGHDAVPVLHDRHDLLLVPHRGHRERNGGR